MIYLQTDLISGLGEDTFWTWFKREVPESTYEIPSTIADSDVLLRYSTCRKPYVQGGKQVALCWELYPEMDYQLGEHKGWTKENERIYECARRCDFISIPSELIRPFYDAYGQIEVLPIGVNTDLFRPMPAKESLRRRHGIPLDRRVGFWCGTDHEMKGFKALQQYARKNPEVFWIIVWKHKRLDYQLNNSQQFVLVPQETLVELMNCADFFLACGRLRPWFMVEWEAMACNLPCVDISGLDRDVDAEGAESTRQLVFDSSWSRATALKLWLSYIRSLT